MFHHKKIVAIIPARGGSKGIKNKNIVDVHGKPLIQYTIDVAKASRYVDRIIVSTDSEQIAHVSESLGATILSLRPAHLATDEARTIDALLYVVDELREMGEHYDYVVLLQPTQPLRLAKHIDEAIEKIISSDSDSLASVNLVREHPILMRTIEGDTLHNVLNMNSTVRRQDFPDYYRINGSIYINKIDENFNTDTSLNDNKLPYIMDSQFDLDIDTIEDLEYFRYIVSRQMNE